MLDDQLEDRMKSLGALEAFRGLSLKELESQRASLSSKITQLSNRISDLAFNNYRTYANAGRTAEHCIEMFSSINNEMIEVKQQFPNLLDDIEQFDSLSYNMFREFMRLDDATSDSSPIWEILNLNKVMDSCIRGGYYDSAYALTTFALSVQQSKLGENSIIKSVLNTLIEARHGLLDVLFNKFAGPIDLAKSIQVVNNIRKIPYISNTQLRVSLLQYRDIYLEKNIMALMAEPDYGAKIIDAYRDCMYDTIVLYLAVFPDRDFQKRNISEDQLWERWTSGSQNYLLQTWAHRNLDVMFERIRSSEQRSPLDLETVSGKLMSFAYSFGRMGMDFRPLIIHEIAQITIETFSRRIAKITETFIGQKQINLLDDDIFENSKSEIERKSRVEEASVLTAPIEMCVWDDLCVYGNGVVDALNELRHFVSPVFTNEVFILLKSSLDAILDWISRFNSENEKEVPERATVLLTRFFLPFMNRCFHSVFAYDRTFKPFLKTSLSYEDYMDHYNFLPSEYRTEDRVPSDGNGPTNVNDEQEEKPQQSSVEVTTEENEVVTSKELETPVVPSDD
ncbi:hypothetical protein M3Y94_00276900 [Aphelenchoides besseyi]|nr:hypothetical protein M3Y94_00276900 [Aphelenchoides besseyi]KAI6236036.1 Conserved oligomeric Golgi complex component 8 [Aphelenchoides besseyi]